MAKKAKPQPAPPPVVAPVKKAKKAKVVMPDEAFFVTAKTDDVDDEPPKKIKIPSPFTEKLPPDRTWPTAPVYEKSATLLAWIKDCQGIVDAQFGAGVNHLVAKVITNFIWITMQSKTEIRSFAFIEKKTGNIHCPALFDEPFSHAHGNITDDVTRISVISPWGVHTTWSWLPTYPETERYIRPRK